jgi:3-deoxy-D-manno-octulosonic-acid transferase
MNPLLRIAYGGLGALARVAVATGVPGDSKLARSVTDRRGLLDRYREFGDTSRDASRPLVWFHAPSVGEGLQATPVMARLRARHAGLQLAYTHFSPSAAAFAQRSGAEFRDYLPFDIAHDMRVALDALRPSALVFSKLDVWPVLVEEAVRRRVAVGMISATLAESSGRRSGLAAAVARDAYAALSAVGAIDDADAARLVEVGVRPSAIRVTGDTRYDQVWVRAQNAMTTAPWLSRFRDHPRVTLVAGSTWPADEAALLPVWRELCARWPGALRLIIAPHEPTLAHIRPIEAWASQSQLTCARLDAADDARTDVVLVDRTGVLGDVYAVADAAFVGGGFHDAGLHSVLEPAAFGAPVVFGPQFSNSRDAALLIGSGGGRSVLDGRALMATLERWLEPGAAAARVGAGEQARALVEAGLGAADRAVELVEGLLRHDRLR